jgi:hypothetical protein
VTAAVEVNECRVFATQMGVDWWNLFRHAHTDSGRITTLTPSPAGDLCSVACDSREDAQWLASHMLEQGLPKSAVKVRVGAR